MDLTPRPSAPTERSAHESPAIGADHSDPRVAALDSSTGTDGDTNANANATGGTGHLPLGARLRHRTDAFGAFTPVSFDALGFSGAPEIISAWDAAGARGPVEAALRNVALARRSGLIEADTAHTEQLDDGRAAPSTLSELLLDPVRISSVTFSAGFIWWLTRGGGLLATLLMGIPAWRHIDLLPVLARTHDEDAQDDRADGADDPDSEIYTDIGADEAVAALFERAGGTPQPPHKSP